VDLAVSRTAGLPTLQTMITSEGRVYAMYHTQQVQRQVSPTGDSRSHNKLTAGLVEPVHPFEGVALRIASASSIGPELLRKAAYSLVEIHRAAPTSFAVSDGRRPFKRGRSAGSC
jgi:hypothetical protein